MLVHNRVDYSPVLYGRKEDTMQSTMVNNNGKFVISLQTDSKGQQGDVRDVLLTGNGWEIGMSCKHNHEAVNVRISFIFRQ